MSIQSQTVITVPLNRLVVSPQNVRRRNPKADIEELAASIAAVGLLQNLAVVDAGEGRFAVVAGGRRLAALKLLAKSGTIARDFPVPCCVVPADESREASLTENVHRVGMDPIDEADAFAAVMAQGRTIEETARRFGATCRHVEQRLALARISPKLKAAWKRGDLTLDAARAFCLVDDHARQDAVFRSMSKPVTQAASVRSRLMEGGMRASDRFAVFVGLDAYEAAGGKLVRDLFDQDAVFIEDPALVATLAEAALNAQCAAWKDKGWGWVEASLDGRPVEQLSSLRVYPEWRDPTEAEQAELDRLEAELAKLDADLDRSSIENDPRWGMRDDLEAAYETVRQQARDWDPALIALAGVMLTIGHDGEVVATEGLVRKDDHKKLEAVKRGAQPAEEEPMPAVDAAGGKSVMPRALARDLTAARNEAIRAGIAGDPDIALAVCVASLASRALRCCDLAGVGLVLRQSGGEDVGLEAGVARLFEGEDILRQAICLDRETLLGVLARLIGSAVNLTHENAIQIDHERQATADAIAQALDLDMTRRWRADEAFWMRLPKASLLEILGDSPAAAKLSDKARLAFMTASAKLKKDKLASRLQDAFKESAYLPDLLVTPLAAGQLEIVDDGAARVAAEY